MRQFLLSCFRSLKLATEPFNTYFAQQLLLCPRALRAAIFPSSFAPSNIRLSSYHFATGGHNDRSGRGDSHRRPRHGSGRTQPPADRVARMGGQD